MVIKKGRNLTSGVRFSESARSIFSLWVQNKRVIENGWNFDKKCFDRENSIFDAQDSIWGVTGSRRFDRGHSVAARSPFWASQERGLLMGKNIMDFTWPSCGFPWDGWNVDLKLRW